MKLSDAEWTVMNVVWQDSPASAREVIERIEPRTSWAYTTVKTILARLADKGALRVKKRANTSLYEPLVTRRQARREAVRSLLDKAFDGTFGALAQHLVADEKLSKRDALRLAEMLADLDRAKGDRT